MVLLEGTLETDINLQFSTVAGTAKTSGIIKIIFYKNNDQFCCGELFSRLNLYCSGHP